MKEKTIHDQSRNIQNESRSENESYDLKIDMGYPIHGFHFATKPDPRKLENENRVV
jgi:hypothetical protein